MSNIAIHTLIIWSKAVESKDFILSDLKTSFIIKNIFKFHWEKDVFFKNLIPFYAHSQKELSPIEYFDILKYKINHCGDDDFYVIVFEDKNPVYEEVETSSGKQKVNINVFAKKTKYRELTGGGHKIHTSNSNWETNKDLFVLFGLNIENFYKKYVSYTDKVFEYSENCIGVDGFLSIVQFFHYLNDTIQYCVLRNFDCIPEKYTVEGHGDIDLLVENKNYIVYLTSAQGVFKEPYRVYYHVKINGQIVPFDFRYVGDDYYDEKWQNQILADRIINKNLFYIPSIEDFFYSLLYHAYIQKPSPKDDYIVKLSTVASQLSIDFKSDNRFRFELLKNFMEKHGYNFCIPKDKTVFINFANACFNEYIQEKGFKIKDLEIEGLESSVYKKKDSYVKKGTKSLILNEKKHLDKFQQDDRFPQILSYKEVYDEAEMEISIIKGVDLFSFWSTKRHYKKQIIKDFVVQTVAIAQLLKEKGTIHRDFMPNNLLVDEKEKGCKVGLIDFGWAINVGEENVFTPESLGDEYRSQNGFSDFYSLGKIFSKIFWKRIPYTKRVSEVLMSFLPSDYYDEVSYMSKLNLLYTTINRNFTIKDSLFVFLWRYRKFLNKCIGRLLKFLGK